MPVVTQGNHRWFPSIEPLSSALHYVFLEGLFDTLEAAGWTAVSWSDGTTVTPGARGAVMATTNSWKLYVNAAGTMWYRVQVGSPTYQWRSFVSLGLPTGGTGSTMPTHATDIQLWGTSGSFGSVFATDATTQRMHAWANVEETTIGSFRAFLTVLMTKGNNSLVEFHGVETLDQTADGVVGDPDNAPFVVCRSSSSISNLSRSGSTGRWNIWYRYGLTGELLDNASGPAWGQVYVNSSHYFPGNVDFTDPMTGRYRKSRCWIGSATGGRTQAPKGRAVHFRYPGPGTGTLGNFQRLDPTTTEAYLRLGDFLVPWPQNEASPI